MIYKKGHRDAEAEVLEKISDSIFLCRVYVLQFYFVFIFELKYSYRHRLQQMHNIRSEGVVQDTDNAGISEREMAQDSFIDVEMPVDGSAFDGNLADIAPGVFVSFRYTAWIGSPPPLNPKVSFRVHKNDSGA